MQTIGRDEICALLQVAAIAARFAGVACEVWSDSTYAIHFMSQIGDGVSANKLPANDADLCEWASIWSTPPNLTIHKVKSHASLSSASPENARRFLGNQVADSAAEAASAHDAEGILCLHADVEQHYETHRDMLLSFFQYQAELTKLVSQAKDVEFKRYATGSQSPSTWREPLARVPGGVVPNLSLASLVHDLCVDMHTVVMASVQ